MLGEGATFLVLESLDAARARGARIVAELVEQAWGNVPASAHAARPGRADRGSPVGRLLAAHAVPGFRRVYGAGNGDAGVDDWERGLLARDLGPRDAPPLSLAPLFGQHGGLGALRVAAAALDAARGVSPVLVHGIARGGCRTALIVGAWTPTPWTPSRTMSDHLIVIPVHNEAGTIGDVVRGAARHGDVLVVDDGSTDGSSEVAASAGRT